MDTETGDKKESGIIIVTGSNGTITDAKQHRGLYGAGDGQQCWRRSEPSSRKGSV